MACRLVGIFFGIFLTGPLRTQFNEILIEIYTLPFKKMYLKMPSGKSRPFCLGLNVCLYSILTCITMTSLVSQIIGYLIICLNACSH